MTTEPTKTTELTTGAPPRVSLTEAMAQQMNLEPASLMELLRTQIIGVPSGEPPATNAEMAVVLSVMRDLGLSPMVREIHAWRDNKGKLCVMVGYDGWVAFAHRNADFSHVSYMYSDEFVTPEKGRPCPTWIAPTLHKKDGTAIKFPPVFLQEWYVEPRGQYKTAGPWQNHTSHRLRQKAFCIIVREVYGMSAMDEFDAENVKIMDEDERDRVRVETVGRLDKDAAAISEKVQGLRSNAAAAFKDEAVAEFTEVTEKPAETEPPAVTEDKPQDERTEEPVQFDNDEDCTASFCGQIATFICEDCGYVYCDRHRKPNSNTCTICGTKGGGRG